MTEREAKILEYYSKDPFAMKRKYLKEAVLLKKAKEFVGMFENCLIIREAFATTNGTADLLICYKGNFIACELKAMDGVASINQKLFVDKVHKAGGRAAVCESLQDIWELMTHTAPNS